MNLPLKAQYIGQCDVLRRRSACDEDKWQAMMVHARPVPFPAFLAHADLSPLLDEDESPVEYLRSAIRSDPDTRVYQSWWGQERCWFLQTAGFEFIFVRD